HTRRGIKREDQAAVATSPPSEVLAERRAKAEAEASMANAKQRFLALLDGWERLPGEFAMTVPPALRAALATLPAEAFELDRRPARPSVRRRAQLPRALRGQLAEGPLAYDVALAEAARREAHHGSPDGLLVLSTLVEQSPGDLGLARDVAARAQAWGHAGEAHDLFLRVGRSRPWERSAWLAVGRCLARMGHAALALPFFEVSLQQGVPTYGDMPRVAAIDYESVLYQVAASREPSALRAYARTRQPQVEGIANVDESDLVVILEWNTDRTDVDLHVTDAAGETCYYEHRTTKMGGSISADVTTGFGPELFVLPKAAAGDYRMEAKYFRGDNRRTQARTRVSARIIQDYGRRTQSERTVTILLEKPEALHLLDKITR
ncbi:MAG: hypothetical protein P1V36_18110, partial [Planctomycetota bacterium]|nr:hypothetical protein [Planctomycetota bacterium]